MGRGLRFGVFVGCAAWLWVTGQVAHAQAPTSAAAPESYEQASTLGAPEPTATLPSAQDPEPRGPGVSLGRVGAELGGGVVGGALAVGITVGTFELGRSVLDEEDCDDCAGAVLLTAPFALGAVATLPALGVYLAGNALGGSGAYGSVVLGNAAGVGAGLTVLLLLSDSTQPAAKGAGFALLGALPLAGSILAYELSSDDNYEPEPSPAILPTVSPTADGRGAMLGVSGTL